MPRPRIGDDARRTETLAFRLTPAERLQVESAAVAAGLTASEFARKLALRGKVVIEQGRALEPAVFDELRRIGVNLNQAARIANQTGHIPARLENTLAMLEQLLIREIAGDPAPRRPSSQAMPAPKGP